MSIAAPFHSGTILAGRVNAFYRRNKLIECVKQEWQCLQIQNSDRQLSLFLEEQMPRFCVNYRRLSAATKKDSYLITRINVRIDPSGEKEVCSTHDARSK